MQPRTFRLLTYVPLTTSWTVYRSALYWIAEADEYLRARHPEFPPIPNEIPRDPHALGEVLDLIAEVMEVTKAIDEGRYDHAKEFLVDYLDTTIEEEL